MPFTQRRKFDPGFILKASLKKTFLVETLNPMPNRIAARDGPYRGTPHSCSSHESRYGSFEFGFRRPAPFPEPCVSYATIALVAERGDGWHVQQAGVLGTVRSVASQTPLSLDRDVFIDERPARLGVALGADRVLVGRGLHVVR